jgi:hypothetical protein
MREQPCSGGTAAAGVMTDRARDAIETQNTISRT